MKKYYDKLSRHKGIKFQKIAKSSYNYSYMPIVLESEETALKVEDSLNSNGIFPRRYFHPSLDTLNYFDKPNNCPISQDISSRILCLPSHSLLTNDEIDKISLVIEKDLSV